MNEAFLAGLKCKNVSLYKSEGDSRDWEVHKTNVTNPNHYQTIIFQINSGLVSFWCGVKYKPGPLFFQIPPDTRQ